MPYMISELSTGTPGSQLALSCAKLLRMSIRRARRDLAEDQRLGLSGEAKDTVIFRDQHAQESVRLHEVQDIGRHEALRVADLTMVDHGAKLIGRAVEE